MESPTLSDLLLTWYDKHARHLPWRVRGKAKPDPYAVWLSEIMLQQTTVEAVKSYYAKFLDLWPTVQALAEAPSEDIMRAWAGLGYYSRARNLHACARQVVAEHGGQFPADEVELRKLPGIGPYTAAAIAAIAFGKRAVVVDGNVERVATRLFCIGEALPQAKAAIRVATDRITPQARAGDFAQAMMDLGATICTPKRPACALCPLSGPCQARAAGTMEAYPVKAPKAARPERAGAALYLRRDDGMIAVRTRPEKGLLGGMTEFPGTEWVDAGQYRQPATVRQFGRVFRRAPDPVTHIFTHFALRLDVYFAKVENEAAPPEGCRWVREESLLREALPTVFVKVAKAARGCL
ncbi:A/G-specific adenine glycosylase [Methylovirgula sp. 4M-Z18]|uniref:A/G-specific adenine glycosylase n=1 Tax=Methylovirgula sp. 4M-Z18 TaxID=2293567 RepID=UPI000E2ECE20|nr:A/G-specific adenine glycosylase [Methylovirgula sp. 4M-Z18]RFB80189.1 A/G-specific adenine glycosylase [Methylovirgula sp. 4M-Z18]